MKPAFAADPVCTENSILTDYVTESPIAPAVLADRRAAQSPPSPANDVGFNLTVGPDAAPRSINPTTGKRKHVGAIVIFTKQFHQFPGWRFAI
jgi:hypothetical protein